MANHDVIILGSGPAGGTAGIYASRANLKTALVSGPMPGGQLSTTHEVENFPGFPEGLHGPKFGQLVEQQATRFGAELIFDIITEVDFSARPFTLKSESKEYHAQAVIVCTGSNPRKLGVEGEGEFVGRGLSYCATCDGRFFEGKVVAVVGGGDSAVEEAIYLSRIATKVHLIHRRDQLRAGPILQQRVTESEKITVEWNSVVDGLVEGKAGLTAMVLRDTQTDEQRTLDLDGLFVAIGHTPNTDLLDGQLELDPQGYIVTNKLTHTNIEGVFAAGDVADPNFRQAVTAAGTGCSAAIEAARYLDRLESPS